ncbi:acyl transferase/acyl hydrolase/lysophospholipase [Mucor mucedo]|uniref:acyl transferase/acyl hydrolase/lysophospholipase n=1 Tax=Mucor mucedo TaxID=29922 RepID=UPI00221F0336|nr:acyl transferase/acyl hydrolase/lysophospholipase [Mucor mucedo]KAI7892682.1 acyl transferase/acyl hydrolase/lysophospholipase [Mucor mucedo]
MFTLKRCLCRNSLYYIKRELSSSTCHRASSENTKKKVTHNNSPIWSTQFLSKNKQDNDTPRADDDNAFIGSFFTNQTWLTGKMEWLDDLPSVEAINSKMLDLYPQFASQFTHLREGYEKMWEYLTMEDFRKIVDEINKDAHDATKFPELNKDAIVREGTSLSRQEQEFIRLRKQLQKQSFAKFIGEDVNNIDERDIPVVGLASSGGGYRAMIGLTGYLDAMKRSGALDCVMYFAGISGSCWTMAMYYNQLSKANPQQLETHLKSHVNTHWANMSNFINLLTSSPENSKLLLQGAIQRFHQQKGDISLVDIFGVLMEQSQVGEFEKQDMYLTGQSQFLKDGSEPMPIYCVVRHDITLGRSLEDRLRELKEKRDDTNKAAEIERIEKKAREIQDAKEKEGYQWFEFTPYEMGCEEIEAWIPMWSFGRKFENGKNVERLPEQTLDILMGMFGSAFAASLVHFYQEIKSLLPSGSLDKIDETITRYETSMSSYHPISPSSFPNPFHGISGEFKSKEDKIVKRPKAITGSRDLYLMDAGMDNNIPFYPLLRAGRDVDVILAVDLSADIQTATHFDRAESYIKRRGIKGWPLGAGWPKDHDSKEKYPLGSCTIFEGESKETTETTTTNTVKREHPIILAYFPYIVNNTYDPKFDPQEEEFCKTWNFVYTPDQVEKVTGLAKANWDDNLDKIRNILKKTWERKRDERLGGA